MVSDLSPFHHPYPSSVGTRVVTSPRVIGWVGGDENRATATFLFLADFSSASGGASLSRSSLPLSLVGTVRALSHLVSLPAALKTHSIAVRRHRWRRVTLGPTGRDVGLGLPSGTVTQVGPMRGLVW